MRIAIITGSRADRNALMMVRNRLADHDHTLSWTDLCGPANRWKDWSPVGRVNRALSIVTMDVGQQDLLPDLVVIHGDRHEILAAAVAANVMGIPIAHIGGGDVTEGSADDCYRHAITKLSHLHFASHQDAADRIVQMGEQPDRVYVTGCPGLDMVAQTTILTREETFATVGLPVCERLLLVAFHPNTLGDTAVELDALSGVLQSRSEAIVLIGPNADAGADAIRQEWTRLAEKNERAVYFDTLSPQVFYSLMKHCSVMVGNSSAGFYEAPFFGTPVINIGERQMGRRRHDRILQADPNRENIRSRIDFVLTKALPRSPVSNPYGDGKSAGRIAQIIGKVDDPKRLLRKGFNDLIEFIPRPVLEELPY